jgi:hypothetical protein
MLNSFDWIRRSRTGAELLGTLRYLAEEQRAKSKEQEEEKKPYAPESEPYALCSMPSIGPAHSALNSPCQRCWIYPRASCSDQADDPYCKFCKAILDKTRGLGPVSRASIVVWGFVNRLPKQLQNATRRQGDKGTGDMRHENGDTKPSSLKSQVSDRLGVYIHDENRFLLMMYRRGLRPWFQELILYNGADLKGLLQILPTTGSAGGINMGESLCRAIHHEANFPMDRLRVRFYSDAHQVLKAHIRDRQGLLTFEAAEFLRLLEMAKIFRVSLRPEEQKMLYELLTIDKNLEEQFHWGRFQGRLSQEAKDMLNSWRIRHWPKNRVKLLYELIDYVYIALPEFH